MRLPILLLVACGGGTVPTSPTVTAKSVHALVGELLVDAAQRHDAAAIATMLAPDVAYGGLLFDDAQCTAQFPTQVKIAADKRQAFAACLAMLPLRHSARRHALQDIEMLEYTPGIEVEVQILAKNDRAWVTWIGFAGRRDARDALPTITGTALDALRFDLAAPKLDDAALAALASNAKENELDNQQAWLKICIDTTGTVTGVHAREITSHIAEKVFVDEASHWRFRPFEHGGHPLPVCAMKLVSLSPSTELEILPVPAAPADGSAARILPRAAKRTAGVKNVAPDDQDKTLISQSHVVGVVGSFKVCFDATGTVQRVTALKSTGLPGYDDKIIRTVRAWKYRPILVDGHGIDVCTAVTFIYKQH